MEEEEEEEDEWLLAPSNSKELTNAEANLT